MSNSLDAVLAQYEKNKQSGGSTKPQMTSEERMKQYLSIMLPKGTKQGEKRDKDGKRKQRDKKTTTTTTFKFSSLEPSVNKHGNKKPTT